MGKNKDVKKLKRLLSLTIAVVLILSSFLTFNLTANAVGEITAIKQISASKTGFRIRWVNSWSHLSDGSITYDVHLTDSKSAPRVFKAIKDTSLIINSLVPGRSYAVRVRPRNGETIGKWSSKYIATTSCSDVSLKQTAASSDTVTLKWNKVQGASGYVVYQQNRASKGIVYKKLKKTKATSANIVIKNNNDKSIKDYNLALMVRPYRKTAAYIAKTAPDEMSSSAFVKRPKVLSFGIATPYMHNNKLVLKSNKWVSGFMYETYSSKNKLIHSGKAKSLGKYACVSIASGHIYKVKAKAYVRFNKKTYSSKWSKKASLSSASSLNCYWDKNTIKASWSKISEATGYNIRVEQSNNKSVSFVKNGYKKNSITITRKELPSIRINKPYKVYISPYIKEKNKKAQNFSSVSKQLNHIEIIGHRGVRDLAPENTIVSFKGAKKAGYDTFECDFWETTSGDLIVCHDDTLRMCGHPNLDVRTLTAETRKNYPVKVDPNVKKYPTQYLPTVQEAVKTASKLQMKLILHCKDNKTSEAGLNKLCKILKKYNMLGRTTVLSSNKACSKRIAKHECKTGLLRIAKNDQVLPAALKFMKKNNIKWLVTRINPYLTTGVANMAHKYGIEIGSYAVNSPALAAQQTNIGADFLITDFYYLNK